MKLQPVLRKKDEISSELIETLECLPSVIDTYDEVHFRGYVQGLKFALSLYPIPKETIKEEDNNERDDNNSQ